MNINSIHSLHIEDYNVHAQLQLQLLSVAQLVTTNFF